MKNTFLLKIIYKSSLSLYSITSTVESVQGVRIQRMNFISKGRDFVGWIAVEATNLVHFNDAVDLIRRIRDIRKIESISESGRPYRLYTESQSIPGENLISPNEV